MLVMGCVQPVNYCTSNPSTFCQPLGNNPPRLARAPMYSSRSLNDRLMAVSYTHLDVYKRQELTHSAIGQAQVDTITAAGLALKEAGVLPATTDVKAAVDSLVDRRFAATN